MDEKNLDSTKEFNIDDIMMEALPKTEEISIGLEEKDEPLEIVTFDESGSKKKKKEKEKNPDKKNIFKKLWEKFLSLKTGVKILIIVAILLVIAGTVILVWALTRKEEEPKTPEEEITIVVKDNYRYENGKLIIMNEQEKDIGEYECQNKDESLCYVAYTLSDDNFNNPKKVLSDGSLYRERSKVYHERYVFIFDNKKEEDTIIILYDLKDNKEIDTFIGVKHYNTENSDILILKNKESKYALLELKADGLATVLDYKYEYLGIVPAKANEGIVVAKESGKWSLVDFSGKVQAKQVDYEIKDYNNKFIVVNNSDKLYIIDYTKNFVSKDAYDYVELLDGYFILVTEDKLYVKDYELNKYNEEGIVLYNKDYNKVYTFDESGKQSDVKYAYSYDFMNMKINFTVSETEDKTLEKTINMMEGKISSKQNFYSYFDGVLYFYKDGEKTELIGKYTCTNANSLTDSSTEFDKCYIASDENKDDNDLVESLNISSVTPIINERFVFIRDGEKLATESAKIKLYNLQTKKTLASYVSVNTYSKAGNSAVYHESVTNKIVIATNSSGKMGAFKITSDNVGGVVDFSYDIVERLGNDLLTKKNGKWQVMTTSGATVGPTFDEQIRGYSGSIFKTLKNGKYNVYHVDTSGNATAVGSGYKYVEPSKTYYAAVDNSNKVNIYDSTGNSILADGVALSSNDYYGVQNPAFTFTTDGNIGTLTINGTKNIYNLNNGEKLN